LLKGKRGMLLVLGKKGGGEKWNFSSSQTPPYIVTKKDWDRKLREKKRKGEKNRNEIKKKKLNN